jgi:hypothetical protein
MYSSFWIIVEESRSCINQFHWKRLWP